MAALTLELTEKSFPAVGGAARRRVLEAIELTLAPGERVVIRHVCAPLFTLTVSLAAASSMSNVRPSMNQFICIKVSGTRRTGADAEGWKRSTDRRSGT